MRNLVVAYGGNRVIGAGNELPWRGQMPADMHHFRELTLGHAVIMGRKTFESIGRPLPGRINYVVSRTVLEIAGCTVVEDLGTALIETDDNPHIESFVIGGEQVYKEAFPLMDRLYVTEIAGEFEGDTYFPEINHGDWALTHTDFHYTDGKNAFPCQFLTYERRPKNA